MIAEEEKKAVDPVASVAKRLVSWKVIAGVAGSLVVFGFVAAVSLGRFAKASELEAHEKKDEKSAEEVTKRLADHDTSIAVLKDGQRRVEDDLHFLMDQSIETARRVGAPVLTAPPHRR